MMTNPTGRLTQGQFSFLPDLTDAEIALQIEYGLKQGLRLGVEYTDDPHPRNTYWEMFGMPMFDLHDAAGVMLELKSCRATFPQHYIRLVAFDSTRGVETIAMSFIVNRPARRAGLRAGAPGDERPHDALHDPRLRSRPAGRRAVPQSHDGLERDVQHSGLLTSPASAGEVGRRPGEGSEHKPSPNPLPLSWERG